MSVVIRPFDERDLPSLRNLSQQIVDDGTVFPFEDMQGVLDYWLSKSSLAFVAEIDQVVVGSFVVKPNFPDRCSHIANAGYMVDTNFRRQGVGRAMAQKSLDIAVEAGFLAMQFNLVVETNAGAVRLWEDLGFVKIGRIPAAFRHPKNGLVGVWIMHRELT